MTTLIPCKLHVRDVHASYEGHTFVFEQEQILIGRTPACDLTLTNPRRIVSRQHALIRQHEGQFQVMDLGSKNTTQLNGERLQAEQAYSLQHGDSVRVGDFEIIFGVANSTDTIHVIEGAGDSTRGLLHRLYNHLAAQTDGGPGLGGVSAQRAIKELILLGELAFDLSASFDVVTYTETVLRHVLRAVSAERGTILLLDEQEGNGAGAEMTCTQSGLNAWPAHPLDPALLEWMREHRAPLRWSRFQEQDAPFGRYRDESVQAFTGMPLLVQGRLAGAIVVFNKQVRDCFTAADERLLAIIAAQTGPMIVNARRHRAGRAREQARRPLDATQAHLLHLPRPASLGMLMAGAAYEIGTALRYIDHFAGLVTKLVSELAAVVDAPADAASAERDSSLRALAGRLKGYAAQIEAHEHHAAELVWCLRDRVRGAMGHRQMIGLNILVSMYAERASSCLQADGATAACVFEQDLDDAVGIVEVVPEELGQVLTMLIENAWYAVRKRGPDAPPGYVPRVRVATRQQEDSVEIHVEDNAGGIPEDIQPRVFEPFCTTGVAGGIPGFGLSAGYVLITQGYGGMMHVTSRPGEGTTFVVRLPLWEAGTVMQASGVRPMPLG